MVYSEIASEMRLTRVVASSASRKMLRRASMLCHTSLAALVVDPVTAGFGGSAMQSVPASVSSTTG